MTYRLAARFYDLFGSKNDLEFYKELALKSGTQALELGVGTGRVAIQLAKAGIRVIGIDNSVQMLSVAREKLANEKKAIRKRVLLRRGDMRNFELSQSFPFIYVPASTFDHNVTVEDQTHTLNCVYKHLAKNGTFAFDLEQARSDQPDASWWIDRKETDKGRMVVRSIFTRRHTQERTCSLDLFFDVYQDGKLLTRFHEYGRVAILSRAEVTKLLQDNGFRIRAVYGDFDKAKYRKDSPRIIVIASKE